MIQEEIPLQVIQIVLDDRLDSMGDGTEFITDAQIASGLSAVLGRAVPLSEANWLMFLFSDYDFREN